jgi:DNA-binding transcriptional LysR family regulator
LGETWDRLDAWPLFTERLCLAVSTAHALALAGRDSVAASELASEHILLRTYCEMVDDFLEFLKNEKLNTVVSHKIVSEPDLVTLVEANLGVGMLPESAAKPDRVRLLSVEGLDLQRTICLYGVAGRQRAPAAGALVRLMRAGDWSARAA